MNLLFVDFDNVLFIPEFRGKGLGMSQDEWFSWCVRFKNASYIDSKPVSFMKDYIKSRTDITKIYVLTVTCSSYELDVKRYMCNKDYNGIFTDVISVCSPIEKLKMIKVIAEKEHISLSNCELIEDDYSLLLKANELGIVGSHISNVASLMYRRANEYRYKDKSEDNV
jgi:hypothetical protein